MTKVELIERDNKFFIRKKWGLFTLWWHNGYLAGWELFRGPMSRVEAEEVFARLQKQAIDKARFAAASDNVIKTFGEPPLWSPELQARIDEMEKMGRELKETANRIRTS
jgi:hypothetical protein